MDVTGDGSKVQCYKELYCLGTWNVGSVNQGKLKVIKQEMAKVNINILEISELKWTGMGGIISTTVGKNSLEVMEEPSWSTKEFKMQYLDAISKMTE